MASSRQRFLATEDEDELLALQEQMKATGAAPAASVTRIQRKAAAPAASSSSVATPTEASSSSHQHGEPSCGCSHPHCEHSHDPTSPAVPSVDSLMAAMQNAMKDIVGEVQERDTDNANVAAPATSGAAFPAAMHRKQSKFSLARQKKQQTPTESSADKGGQVSSRAAATAPQHAAAAAAPEPGGSISEAESISKETSAVLEAMTPEQIEAAREEVLSRLPPAAAAFLKQRGAQKAAASGGSSSVGDDGSGNGTAEPGLENSKVVSSTSTAMHDAAPADAADATTTATKTATQTFQNAQTFKPEASAPSPTPALSLASLLRFDISGSVVGLKDSTDTTATAAAYSQVVSRDPVRESEGAWTGATEGYTVEEACLLARSTVPQQRVFALRLLANLLQKVKPTSTKSIVSNIDLPVEVVESLKQEESKISWIDIWRHALHEVRVPLALRVALDDTNAAVTTAAAEAIAALLSPGSGEVSTIQSADNNPIVGWPSLPLRHLQRPNDAAAWVGAPVDLQARRQRREEAKKQAAAGRKVHFEGDEEESEDEDDDDVDERELARVDPMTGLLNMQLLERVAYLLGVLRPPGGTAPLLKIICSVCCAGPDTARALCETAGMLDAVAKVALEPAANERNAVLVFKTLSMLCQASRLSARAVHSHPGLLSTLVLPLLLKPLPLAADTDALTSRKESVDCHLEALKIWRCLGMHGLHLISGDDAYPALCRYLTPSLDQFSLIDWEMAREGYLALAQLRAVHAVYPDQEESQWMSQDCANSVAKQTLEWACGLAEKLALKVTQLDAASSAEDWEGSVDVILSGFSASIYFLDCHWRDLSAAGLAANQDKASIFSTLHDAGIVVVGGTEGPPITTETCISAAITLQLGTIFSLTDKSAQIKRISSSFGTSLMNLALTLSRLQAALAPSPLPIEPRSYTALEPFYKNPSYLVDLLSSLEDSVDKTLIQPWDMPRMQTILQLARCIAAAGTFSASNNPKNIVSVATAALRALPPGAEDVALQLLAICFSTEAVKTTLSDAYTYIDANKDALSSVAAVLEGSDADKLPFTEENVPPAKAMGQVLLAGYAAAWLGFVQEQSSSHTHDSAAALGPAFIHALIRPQGSTLPLPSSWPLFCSPVPPADSHVHASPAVCTGYALLWTLGTLQSTNNNADFGLLAAKKAVQLVFDSQDSNSGNIVGGGGGPAKLGAILEEEEESSEPWQDLRVRWSLSTLVHCILHSTHSMPSQQHFWTVSEAQRLVENFCSSSLGDSLFGASVALLFASEFAPLDVQLEALTTLSDGHSLHLLPPLEKCLGPPMLYLHPPASSTSSAPTPELVKQRTAEDAYLKLLSSSQIAKCVQTDSMILSIILHRLAAQIFPKSSEEATAKQRALLCSVIRRLKGNSDALPALGMLLRWSCEEGIASDVVTAERLEFVKRACEGVGSGGEGLYDVAMAALHT